MSYSPRSRDRYRLAVVAVSGLAAAGALTSTGWLAGAAAQDYAAQQASRQAEQDAAGAKAARAQAKYERAVARQKTRALRPRVVLRPRPTTTRVTTRYVQGAAPATPVVGGGGTVSAPPAAPSAPHAPVHPAPAPPPPPPPPAPSNGS